MLYPLAVTIEPNRGRGEIRSIAPASVTFRHRRLVSRRALQSASPCRCPTLTCDGGEPLEIFWAGSVRAVSIDGALFVVEASIDEYDFRHTKSGPSTDAS